MRKITVSMFVSLDGVVEDPGGSEKSVHGGWTFPYWNEQTAKCKLEEMFASDALLLGRKTYEGFAAAWPSQKDEAGFADRMNSVPKYVVSTTLQKAEWNNSTIIKSNVVEEITKLKQADGQDIMVAGSVSLVQTLREHNLIDRYRLLVYPIILGSGKRLFPEGTKAPLTLVQSEAYSTGVVALVYEAAGK
jgi:dihydrofolate reductase